MRKHKVVISDHVFPSLDLERAELDKIGAVLVQSPGIKEGDIISVAADADALIVCYAEITREIINSLKNCKIIARCGIGINNINLEAATQQGIKVTNVPDYCIDEVSDHALALLLALARKIPALDRTVKRGGWSFDAYRPMYRLNGKILGLVGFGKIAMEVAKKAKPLGFRILIYDPYVSSEVFKKHEVEFLPLAEILRQADFVSLHAPLTAETRHLISSEELQAMKKTAYLINTSRGLLIDEVALYLALKENWIAGAALDVLASEELDPANPLLKLENLVLTPHAAFYSEESTMELRTKTIDEVVRALTGRPPRNLVNRELLAG